MSAQGVSIAPSVSSAVTAGAPLGSAVLSTIAAASLPGAGRYRVRAFVVVESAVETARTNARLRFNGTQITLLNTSQDDVVEWEGDVDVTATSANNATPSGALDIQVVNNAAAATNYTSTLIATRIA